MFTLMKENLVQEVTILSQNIKKKTQRAVAVIEDYNGDDVLSLLEKYAKQYDLYAFLLEESHRTVFLKEIEEMGFSKSSLDALIKKGYVEKYDAEVHRDPLQIVYLNKKKRDLTQDQQQAYDAVKIKSIMKKREHFTTWGDRFR